VELDFEPLVSVASMLYGASFVAERYSGLRSFLEDGGSDKEGGAKHPAAAKKRKLLGQQPEVATALASLSDDASDSEVRKLGLRRAGGV
jgi:hypothetical protein